MIKRFIILTSVIAAFGSLGVTGAQAQTRQPAARRAAQPQSNSVSIGGYAMFGNITFTAADSFDAVVGSKSGPIFGGGARIGLPLGGLFVDVGAFRYHATGERVFVLNDQVFQLGIPVDVTVTPIELSAGWRFRFRGAPRFTPYVAGGFTTLRYRETSDFSSGDEDVDESFNGYHVLGGAEYKITRWFGVAGEASWTTVPDAIGGSGVAKAFNETDLGGTTFRFKITIGR